MFYSSLGDRLAGADLTSLLIIDGLGSMLDPVHLLGLTPPFRVDDIGRSTNKALFEHLDSVPLDDCLHLSRTVLGLVHADGPVGSSMGQVQDTLLDGHH